MAGSIDFYAGCTALITGASAGFGAEFARRLAPVARYLFLVARREDRLEALKKELEEAHPTVRITTRACDLSDPADLEALIRWMEQENVQIDLLINNAGLGDHGHFATSDWERVDQILKVNVAALTRLSHAIIPGMKKRRIGAICNISSIAAFFPVPNMAVYAATKAYVSSLSEALRCELRDSGVSVTSVCPGPVETEFGQVAKREGSTGLNPPEEFKTSVDEVVTKALAAVAHDRPRVIPNFWLALAVLVIAAIPLLLKRPFLDAMGDEDSAQKES